MKKIFAALCTAIMLVACSQVVLEPDSTRYEDIHVNLIVGRSDDFATKATVKSAWADNDVVFVFFKGIAAPKYLELKYNSGTGTWSGTRMNSLTASDLADAAEKKMTAIYLPYGSTATVAANGTDFVFDGLTYNGYFLQAEQVDYTFDGSILTGTLNMVAPTLTDTSDKLIHFDISGFTSGHAYNLYQDFVKPLIFTKVSADGEVAKAEGTMGKAIAGYEDGAMMSFSGILDASAVGSAVDYQFSINDETASILYTRDAGEKTISDAKYIGTGDISNTTTWIGTEYVYLGFNNASDQKICWATKNLGATAVQGEGSFGDYYAFGETTGYALSGTFGNYTSPHSFSVSPYFEVDNNNNLKPQYDAAHVTLKGLWRMPTLAEGILLNDNTAKSSYTEGTVDSGKTFTSTVSGFETKSIFLPAAGYVRGTSLDEVGNIGYYYLATEDNSNGYYFRIESNSVTPDRRTTTNADGQTIRPVFSID